MNLPRQTTASGGDTGRSPARLFPLGNGLERCGFCEADTLFKPGFKRAHLAIKGTEVGAHGLGASLFGLCNIGFLPQLQNLRVLGGGLPRIGETLVLGTGLHRGWLGCGGLALGRFGPRGVRGVRGAWSRTRRGRFFSTLGGAITRLLGAAAWSRGFRRVGKRSGEEQKQGAGKDAAHKQSKGFKLTLTQGCPSVENARPSDGTGAAPRQNTPPPPTCFPPKWSPRPGARSRTPQPFAALSAGLPFRSLPFRASIVA